MTKATAPTATENAIRRFWNAFVARWHYLGYTPLVGAQMRYAVEDREGRPLAMLGFPAAAWKTAPRDSFIGWSPEVRERSLQRLVGNSRYLIMLWVRIPDLASHILSEARRRLPRDWHDRYGVTPVLMETFVEVPRFTGAVYKASGWIRVGTTLGRGRYDRKNEWAKFRKDIWLCPLRRDWKRTPSRCPPPGPARTLATGARLRQRTATENGTGTNTRKAQSRILDVGVRRRSGHLCRSARRIGRRGAQMARHFTTERLRSPPAFLSALTRPDVHWRPTVQPPSRRSRPATCSGLRPSSGSPSTCAQRSGVIFRGTPDLSTGHC